MNLYRPKSLLSAFLAVIFPLTLLLAAALFLAIQTNEHNKDHQFLQNKLNDILATHSSVLAMPVWNLDDKRVQVIIEAISQDIDVCGVAVFDKRHSRYGAIGVFDGMTYEESKEWAAHQVGWDTGVGAIIDHLRQAAGIGERHIENMASRERLIFQTDAGPIEVGDLFVAISYKNLGNQLLGRIVLNAGVSLFALLLVALCVLFAYRRIVGIPLARLLKTITTAQTNVNDESAELNLKSVREVDRVINAFHTLQSMQVELEKNLREARDSLERQVEERTASLVQSKKKLEKNEKKYRELFENILDVSYQTDAEGNFVLISPSVEKLFGYAPEELIGKNIKEFYRSPSKREEFLHQLKQKKIVENFEAEINKKNGSCAWVSTNARLLLDEEGNFLGVEGVTRDITQLKEAEEEKKNLQTQLIQSQKMEAVGRLAGGVAHDFNNMLSVIIGHTDMALAEVDSAEPLHADLKEIRNAGERSADLTRQLLAFARKQTVAPKVLDLNKTVEGMTRMLQRLIGEDIDLAWIPGEKVWPVKVDPSQIDQILANLCINARDAIVDVGKVTIETGNTVFDEAYCTDHLGYVPGEYVQLAVSDNGCGMDTETLGNVFEPFFTTKESGKGTGLGLATVYGTIKQNNGFVNVYSERGHGTTFKIYLPRHLTKSAHSPEKVSTQPVGRGHETVLLVEDEPAILRMTTMMLGRLGYTVMAARTPGEAIKLAQEYAGGIDLLVTDVVMPEMNGRNLAKNISSSYPNLKRLFMSGYTANVIAHHGVLDEGVNFIQKPFSKENLGAKVRETLDEDKM